MTRRRRARSWAAAMVVYGFQRRNKLTMMDIPYIFIPEDWPFTFYEGPNWHADSIFRDMTVAELGCGNGWISISLAEKRRPWKLSACWAGTEVLLIHGPAQGE